jgi:hypothetical protein
MLICFTHDIIFLDFLAVHIRGLAYISTSAVILASVDGVHCEIQEPRKVPDKKWFSHKSNGPALTYQVVLALRENTVLQIAGPYPAGEPDIIVFRKADGILRHIPPGKRIIADRGYNGEEGREFLSVPSHLHDSLICNQL